MPRTLENRVEKRVASRDFDNEMAKFSPTSPGVVYWLKHPRVQSLEEALGIFCGALFCGGEQDGGRWRQVLQDTSGQALAKKPLVQGFRGSTRKAYHPCHHGV